MADSQYPSRPPLGCRLSQRHILLPLVPLLLAGCATNALRLEYTSDVAAKGKLAVAASRGFLAEVDRSRVAADVDVIALDPACVPNTTFIRIRPDLAAVKDPDRPPRGWFCAATAQPGFTFPEPFSLAPLGPDLEPTFVLIDALAAYSSGLASIVDEKGPDPAADLTDALGLARSADHLLSAITGSNPVVPAADDPRVTAVQGFIQFLSDLKSESDKVKRVRKFVEERDPEANLIKSLRDHLGVWELSRRTDENLRLTIAGVLVRTAQASDMSAGQRREFATAYYERSASTLAGAKIGPALDGALQEVAAADADLRRVLKDHPNLNAAERAHVAQITRQRLANAFDALASVILSFRGA